MDRLRVLSVFLFLKPKCLHVLALPLSFLTTINSSSSRAAIFVRARDTHSSASWVGSGIPVHLDPYRYAVPRQPVSVHALGITAAYRQPECLTPSPLLDKPASRCNHRPPCWHGGEASAPRQDRLVGLVVKAFASRAGDPEFESRWRRDFFGVESYQWLKKLALQWLPCQAPGDIGSGLRLIGPVSVYCDWVRQNVGSATSISVWQHVEIVWTDPSLRYTRLLLGR